MIDLTKTKIDEKIVLEKFEGDPLPENLFERMHIHNGRITHVETFDNGKLVSTEHRPVEIVGEVD